ncbi:MAG: GNAT family N-acetyltransferase [Novosphingobium sp.]|nr:GNAT family N-acetyltransferase [Novosphingobium sp.]
MAAIREALFPEDAAGVLDIWREFVASPSVSLDYQGNESEFADLPGKYAAPEGRVLLAAADDRIDGCVAFRKVSDAICEMKRLYVRPRARGCGLGRLLVEKLIAAARSSGYAEMRLDVLAEFEAAQKLYADLGFVPAEPVSFSPLPGTLFLGLRLR